MSTIKQDNDASTARCQAGCCPGVADAGLFWITVTYAVIGLTNFGGRPVPSARLAEVLGRPVSEAEALARQWGWPATRVENGLITVDPERAKSVTRRHVQVGDRRFGVTGCAGDVFYYAPLARPSIQVEDICMATGTPIRLVFTPSGVEHVEPAGAAMATMDPQEFTNAVEEAAGDGDIEDVDADVCVRCSPLFASTKAGSGMAGRSSRRPCLPHQGGVGSEHLSGLAGKNVGPAEPRQIAGAAAAMSRTPSIRNHAKGATP